MKKNNATISPEIRLVDMTSGDLIGLINELFDHKIDILKADLPSIVQSANTNDDLCKNREEIARFLGVTASTVWRYYKDGVFGDSVIKERGKMVGRKSEIK